MANKLPNKFRSYIQLYDYIKSQGMQNNSSFTVKIQDMDTGGTIRTFKTTMRNIESHCWREIQEFRMDSQKTVETIHYYHAGKPDYDFEKDKQVIFLLQELQVYVKDN